MTRYIVLSAVALAAALGFLSGRAVSQEAPKPPSEEEQAEGMKRWMEISTPGPEHAFLAKRVGKWKTVNRVWMGGPGSPPAESEGTAEFRTILGGRYLLQEYKGAMVGMNMEGVGISGYDKFRKRYVDLWMDNFSTGVFTLTGHLDPTGKILVMQGEMDEPAMEQIGKAARFVTRIADDDHFVLEAYDVHLGENAKVMEIAYTRVK
jgi:hypothetical protein